MGSMTGAKVAWADQTYHASGGPRGPRTIHSADRLIFAGMTPRGPALLTCSFILAGSLATAQQQGTTLRLRHGSACDTVIALKSMERLTTHAATIRSHDGAEATYEGAWLKDVLKLCPSIATMEKHAMVNSYVRVVAADGYTALIALTETDSSFRERPVVLAWRKNGTPLDDHEGPLQLIVPDDQRHARDVRKVTSVEVVTP
jgi:hypothetical protein